MLETGLPTSEGRPVSFVPCRPKHRSCSRAHAALVGVYRDERWRQEGAAEEASVGYRAELEAYLDQNPLITFKGFLTGGGWASVAHVPRAGCVTRLAD